MNTTADAIPFEIEPFEHHLACLEKLMTEFDEPAADCVIAAGRIAHGAERSLLDCRNVPNQAAALWNQALRRSRVRRARGAAGGRPRDGHPHEKWHAIAAARICEF